MFRLICQRISTLLISNNFRLNGMRNFCNAVEPQSDRNNLVKEDVKVTICGKMTSVNVLPETGALHALIKTFDNLKRPAFHHVIYRGSQAKNLNQSSLQVGERVYVDGWIQSRPFTLPNNKTRTETSIIANRFHICQRLPDGGDDGMFDINEVKLFGRIETAAFRRGNHTYMTVSSRYNELKTEKIRLRYHNLEITHEDLQNLASTLDVGTFVFVNAKLRSYFEESIDGIRKLVTLCSTNKLVPTKSN